MMADPFFAPYDEAFWRQIGSEFNRTASGHIATEVWRLLRPTSVLDVGCGNAAMLGVFKQRGVKSTVGLESQPGIEWCRKLGILVPFGGELLAMDLREENFAKWAWLSGWEPDLVLCIEVVEHLPKEAADRLIREMTRLKPRWLVMSGAEPGQTGTAHINEQEAEYWEAEVQRHGTHKLDGEMGFEFQVAMKQYPERFFWDSHIKFYRRRT